MKLENLSLLTPASAAAAHPAYRSDIDGLRAVAVLSVVLFHAFPHALPGGFAGVDIFFIISGYLIGSILLASLRQGSFSLADFYARRVRRIFPALLLVMSACAAFGWVALFPDEYKMLGKHIVGGAGFVSNFMLWDEVGYFDTAAATKPLLHLWSLGIEEQFYIAWPLLLALAFRRRWNLWYLVLGLAVLSFLVNVALVHRFPTAGFYSPLGRIWELLLGALLAYRAVTAAPAPAATRRHHLQSGAGLLLLALGLALLTSDRAFPGWWALLPTLGALLLIAAGPQAWCNRVLLSNRLLVWVGLISYPLYLWHWPLLSFAHIVESGEPAPLLRASAVAIAVALAWLTYRWLERPLRGPGHGARKVAALSLCMAALAGGGAWIYAHDGLPLRAGIVENAALQKQLIVVEDVAKATACKQRYGFDTPYYYCQLDDVRRDPTVALIGDSHAYHILAGVTRFYHDRGENVWVLGTRVPFFGMPVGTDPYQQATSRMLELALATASVKTVIISTIFKQQTGDAAGVAAVQSLRDTLRRYTAAGKQVILVNDIPHLDFEPRACIRRAGVASSQTRRDCSIARADFERDTADHAAIVAAVLKQYPAVRLFDAAAPLCDAQRCRAMIDGQLMYRDLHHLSYDGDLFVGRAFARQFGAVD